MGSRVEGVNWLCTGTGRIITSHFSLEVTWESSRGLYGASPIMQYFREAILLPVVVVVAIQTILICDIKQFK